jgi:hypothetical protein
MSAGFDKIAFWVIWLPAGVLLGAAYLMVLLLAVPLVVPWAWVKRIRGDEAATAFLWICLTVFVVLIGAYETLVLLGDPVGSLFHLYAP